MKWKTKKKKSEKRREVKTRNLVMLGHYNNFHLPHLPSSVTFCIFMALSSSIPFIHSLFPCFPHTIQIYLFVYPKRAWTP